MPWVKGQSGNPNGRSSGALDRRSMWKKYVDPKVPQMLELGIQMALEGNENVLILFLKRILPKVTKDSLDEQITEANIELAHAKIAEMSEVRTMLEEIKRIVEHK